MINDKFYFLKRFFISISITILGIMAVSSYYRYNDELLLLGGLLLSLLLTYRFSIFKCFLVPIAMLLSLVSDLLAHWLNLWTYSNPTFAIGTPIWVPIGWGMMLILFDDLAGTIFEYIKIKLSQRMFIITINILKIIILMYALVTLFSMNRFYAFFFLIVFIPTFIFVRAPYNTILFIVAAIHGTAFEYFCIQQGAWKYTDPFFAHNGMPISLPLAWGLAGNLIWICARGLTKLLNRYKKLS